MSTYTPLWFQTSCLRPDGSVCTVGWKAYAYASGALFFALRGPLGAVFQRQRLEVCREVRKMKGWWDVMFGHLGWVIDEELPPTARQIMSSAGEARVTSREAATISLRGLLAVFSWWLHDRRPHDARRLCESIMLCFMTRLVSHEFQLTAAVESSMTPGNLAACGAPRDGGSSCPHVREARILAAAHGHHPAMVIMAVSRSLSSQLAVCPAARRCLGAFLDRVSVHVAARITDMGFSSDPYKNCGDSSLQSGGRRSHDEDYKRHMVEDVVRRHTMHSGNALARHDRVDLKRLRDWEATTLSAMQISAYKHFADFTGTLNLCEDGARLGNPAEENIVYLARAPLLKLSMWLPPQVVPDWTGFVGSSGKSKKGSGCVWTQRVREFLSKVRTKRKTKRPSRLTNPRHANRHNMLACDQALIAGCNLSLNHFRALRPLEPLKHDERRYTIDAGDLPPALRASLHGRLRRVCIRSRSGSTRLEVIWSAPRPILHIGCDMGLVGFPSKVFLYSFGRLRGYVWPDPAHRRHDNLLLAVAASGLAVARAERVVTNNTPHGPWEGASHFQTIVAAARQYFSERTHADPLYRSLYDIIVRDLYGEEPAGMGTEEHYAAVWSELPHLPIWQSKGRFTRASRWYQWEVKTMSMLPYDGVLLLVILYVGLCEGWYDNILDTPLCTNAATFEVADLPTAPDGEASAAPRVAVRHSNIVADTVGKKKCANCLNLTANILCNRMNRAASVGMCSLAEPLRHEHGRTQIMLQTQAGHAMWYQEMASLRRIESVTGIVDLLVGIELYEATGLNFLWSNNREASLAMAGHIVSYARHLLYHEINFLSYYHYGLPGRFFAFGDSKACAQSVEYVRRLWRQLERAEAAAAAGDRDLARWLDGVLWTKSTWCREVCVGVVEGAADRPPDDILAEVAAAAVGPLYTTPIENAFNHLRRQADHSSNKCLGRRARWMKCILSGIAEDTDHTLVRPGPAEQAHASAELPSAMFSATMWDSTFSLGQEASDAWLSGKGWPQSTPGDFYKSWMKDIALQNCRNDWGILHKVWQSSLVPAGAVLVHEAESDDPVFEWVLGSSVYGVITWQVELVTRRSARALKFVHTRVAENWNVHIVADLTEYRMMDVKATIGLDWQQKYGLAAKDLHDLGSFILEVSDGPAVPLVEFAARRGFPGVSVHHLGKLVDTLHCDYAPPKPTLLEELLHMLIAHVLPSLSAEEIADIMSQRVQKQKAYVGELDSEAAELARFVLDEGDQEFVKKVAEGKPLSVQDLRAERCEPPKASEERAVARDLPSAKAAGSAASAASSSGAAGPGSAARQPVKPRLEDIMHTAADARQFMPKWRGSVLSIQQGCRWEAKYSDIPSAPKSHTETWGMGQSHRQALLFCLQWAWRHHADMGRGECPWDLSA